MLNLGWDDPLGEEIASNWILLRNNLLKINLIEIPRGIFIEPPTTMELHGFCDASQKAYAAVVYCRTTNADGRFQVMLLGAKTRVAPIKELSIPRLELCGAVLLKQLLMTIQTNTRIPVHKLYAWTDSSIVLDWLSSYSRRWNTFVANRTSNILTSMDRAQWYHIASEENPADCASRGMAPENLSSFTLWWKGPNWLSLAEAHWPLQQQGFGTCEEERKSFSKLEATLSSHIAEVVQQHPLDTIMQRSSSAAKSVRVLAHILRYMKNLRHKREPASLDIPYHQRDECFNAERKLFHHLQTKHFQGEQRALSSNSGIPKSSSLKFLNPFIDEYGILRVGGRLSNSTIAYSAQHPAILSVQEYFNQSLVRETHIRQIHAGPSLLLATLQSTAVSHVSELRLNNQIK